MICKCGNQMEIQYVCEQCGERVACGVDDDVLDDLIATEDYLNDDGGEMSLSDEDKDWIKSNCGKVDRFWLYVMVFIIFLRGCSTNFEVVENEDGSRNINVTRIESKEAAQ